MRAELRGIICSCMRGDLVLSLNSLQDATREVASPPSPLFLFFLRRELRARVMVIHLTVMLANSIHKLSKLSLTASHFP